MNGRTRNGYSAIPVIKAVVDGILRSANSLADEAMVTLAECSRTRGIEFDDEQTGAIRKVVFNTYVDEFHKRLLAGLSDESGHSDDRHE